MIAVIILIFCVIFFVLWVSKSLETFIKAEETIKKNMWEEEKMLDTYSPRCCEKDSASNTHKLR